MTDNGTVGFLSRRFSNPSKLAVAMVNANGGEAKALNGYDYLFIQSPDDGLLSLEELRGRLIGGTQAEKAAAEAVLETGAFGSASEQFNRDQALDWVRENSRVFMRGPKLNGQDKK